jgi:hypothetical protein
MALDRKERLNLSLRGEHAKDNIADGIISGILQTTKEAIGATFEAKNRGLNWILEKCIPEKLKTPKKTWLGKTRRFISKDIFRRALVTANNAVDAVWTAAISTIDIINNTQGEIHDTFTGKDTSQALTSLFYGVNDVVLKRLIKESLRNGLIRNEVGDYNFSGKTQRHYGEKVQHRTVTSSAPTPARTPWRTPAPVPATP